VAAADTPPRLRPAARDRILDAAELLFAARGFAATSTSAIARQADVPAGLLFYYFGSKQALLIALLDERSLLPDVHRLTHAASLADPRATLIAVGRRSLREIDRRGEVIRILIREAHVEPAVAERYQATRQALREAIADYVSRAVAAGRLRPVAALNFARTFVNSIVFGALDEWPTDPAAFVEETVDLLLSGLIP
jgi:AcrR family transcriptional regulator